MTVRVRMAPSPTGFIHIGNLRTCLYDALFAERHKGTLILRIEDTDQKRFVQGAAEAFCRSLKTIGIIPDEGVWINDAGTLIERGPHAPYLQTKRTAIHQARAQELIEKGLAYRCFCSAERLEEMRKAQHDAGLPTRYDRACLKLSPEEAGARLQKGEPHVIRLKVPDHGSVTFHDEIRGDITFDWKEIDDQVIIKADGIATYHLAATSDDHDMEITHVIRGEEWLSSTPKHLFIYQAFGWEPPKFAHVPLLLNADRTKLSKRQGDVSVESYLEKGYLPDALINFIALLGWNPTADREIFNRHELAGLFDLSRVNRSGAVVNFEKLDWLNSHYLKQLPEEEFSAYVHDELAKITQDDDVRRRIAMLIRDRISNKTDIAAIAGDFIPPTEAPQADLVRWKEQTPEDATVRLQTVKELLLIMPVSDWTSPSALEAKIKQMTTDHGWGNGEVLWPLRVALSGKKQSPPPFELLFAFGEKASLNRLDQAIQGLRENSK